MFHRLWTLIRKELQSLLREPQTRAILILPVLIQVILFPFAATLEVTNATIAIYDEDNGEHSVELTHTLPAPSKPRPAPAAVRSTSRRCTMFSVVIPCLLSSL